MKKTISLLTLSFFLLTLTGCFLFTDDGFIRIDHKSSLGPHGYAYFQMDADKAVILNDLVFSLFIVDNGGIE